MKQLLDYLDVFVLALCYLGYLWAADHFCRRYLKTSRKRERLFFVVAMSGWVFLNVVNKQYSLSNIFFLLLEHILFVGLVLLCFQAEWEKKLLAASVLTTAMRLVINISEPLLSCMVLWFKHTVKKIPEPFLNEWEGGLICSVVFCLVTAAVFGMTEQVSSVFCGKPRKWYLLFAIPLLMIVAVFDVADWGAGNGILVRSGGNMGLYYDQLFSHAGYAILAALSMAAAGFYLFGMDRIYLEQKKSGQYQAQVAAYKMLEEQYRQSERLRHDLKNHVIALTGLWENQEWEKLGNYLKKMENSAGLEANEETTGNRVVDVLLYQKRKAAQEWGVVWECDVRIPKPCGIHEFDLCVLFGNILDNAVEACERAMCRESEHESQAFIHVYAGTVKKCFLLEVANSAEADERPQSGCSRKENPQGHGIGLLNVRDVVHRYNGVMNMEIHDGVFAISVLIPLENAVHDI